MCGLRRVALSFSGSGHLLVYHLGVAHRLLRPDSMWASRISHFIGVSGGALAAAVCAFQPESELIARFAEESGVRGLSWAKILGSLEVSAPALRGEDGSAHGAFTLSDEDVRAVSGRRILFLGATQAMRARPATMPPHVVD
uniref:PNPLA domain-containing protein n=1 Tax=Calcidiscus leptoporus TaxID=127549 RepID=A0A7S0J6A3_9EUKA|mmetsp:Transcript_41336/g.96642  ORF Transcript_41336/g.96642 Transcript_41336/m.96642 type:complete len:141 (+) Transcript_41336:116-538(+)